MVKYFLMSKEIPCPENIKSGEAFNTGVLTELVPPTERARMAILSEQMQNIGFDLSAITKQAKTLIEHGNDNEEAAKELAGIAHYTATVLFLQWSKAHEAKDKTTEFAAARLFNRVTLAARKVDEKYNIFDKKHLESLRIDIQQDMVDERELRAKDPNHIYDPSSLARSMEIAARQRNHENSWAWVVLPTFQKQHYGRILLDAVGVYGSTYRVYVTQPTFTNGEATLFHTHGQNWGLSRPLGPEGTNQHINTMWEIHSDRKVYPLRQMPDSKNGKTRYKAGDVAVIPPKSIHAISGARTERPQMSLEEFALLSPLGRRQVIAQTRFGEQSCLHIYRAETPLANEFLDQPVSIIPSVGEKDFFEQNDMIVFDHQRQNTWAGGGGAWDRRLIEYGRTGDHCGECFAEDDPRRENLSDYLVISRFIDQNSKGGILYSGRDLLGLRR